jgi:hypothetical protein
MLSAIITTL